MTTIQRSSKFGARQNQSMIQKLFLSLAFILCVCSIHAQEKDLSISLPDTTASDSAFSLKPSELNLMSLDALDNDLDGQDVSGLLQSSRDPLITMAAFNFNGLWYRLRGFNSDQQSVLVNGIDMNDPNGGFGMWYVWSGLNDITRYQYSVIGLGAYDLQFGGVRGATNINTRASSQRKGTRITYSATNRSYRHRIIATHNTGLLENGWSFSFSGALRYANQGYAEGTYFNGGSYFASADKRINSRHTIGLMALGAPTVQGQQGMVVQEIYDLTDNNYYNPNWGYLNGKKRNIRERRRHVPLIMLNHDFKISDKTKLSSGVYTLFGTNARTNLNWNDAKDPRVDYYRYLPSFFNEPSLEDQAQAQVLTNQWEDGIQVDWESFYFANSKNLFQVNDADGIQGNTVIGNRSKYMVESWHQDPLAVGVNANITHKLSDISRLTGTVSYKNHTTRFFKKVDDLLGGDFWLDVDQFSEQDFIDPTVSQNDLNNLNNVVYKGERQGFDYNINVSNIEAFGMYDVTYKKVDLYGALRLGNQSFYRNGKLKNGRFPNSSLGKSETQNFFHFGIKGGITYKITGQHFLKLNAAYMQNAPNTRNAYINAWNTDELVKGLDQIEVLAGDLNYYVKTPKLKGRLTGFYAQMNNQVQRRTYYHDEFRNFVNFSTRGVNTLHMGIEAAIDYNITSSWRAQGAFASGQYLYNSRALADISVNNSAELLDEDRVIYYKNYRVGGMPQTIGSLGLSYNSSKFWWVGVSGSYYDNYYIDPNPDRRTLEAVEGLVPSDALFQDIIQQEKLDGGFMLNIVGGKSFKVGNRKYLNFILSANNLLNNTDMISFGFEQSRFDNEDIARFPNRYRYLNGLTYFFMARYRF